MICYVSLYFMHRTAVIMSVCPSQVNIYSTCIVTDTQTYSQPSDGWYIKTNIKVSRQNISEHVAKNRNTLSVKLWMWASFPWKTLWNTLLRAVGFCAFRQTSNIWPPCSIADKMKTICSIFKWISDSKNSDFSNAVSCITCSYCLIWTASIYIYISVVFFGADCILLTASLRWAASGAFGAMEAPCVRRLRRLQKEKPGAYRVTQSCVFNIETP